MNFFFGQTHKLSIEHAEQSQQNWIDKTIFGEYQDCISTHIEPGFSLTLINDPKKLCPHQSKSFYINDDFICATDCQLFNKKDLVTQLQIDPGATNEQYVICAFQKWGVKFPDHFDGKFSFILWDRKNRTLLAGLDALGYGNFCYSKISDDFYFASDLATLLDQPKVDKSINMKRFYQCFRYSNNTPEQTYFKNCKHCPPSHVLKLSENKIEFFDYWKISEKVFPQNEKNEQTCSLAFVSLLRQAIENETQEHSKMGLMLSGGYDSSLIAAVLAEQSSWKQRLTCYSYVFERFKSCDESLYIDKTLRQLNLNGQQINCDDKTILSDLSTRRITKDVINMDSYSALPESIYQKASEDHIDIIISGLNGDDIFGGVRYMYADLFKNKQYLTAIKKIFSSSSLTLELNKVLDFGFRPLLPQWIKNLYRLFCNPQQSDNVFNISDKDVNNVDNENIIKNCTLLHHQKLLKVIYYRNMHESLYFRRKSLYLGHNLNLCLPYYTKQMLAFMWTIPIHFLEKKGKFRGIQISGLENFNLQHITNRNSKTSFEQLIENGIIDNQTEIKTIKTASLLIKQSLIKRENLQNLITAIGHGSTAWPIRSFVLAELWWKAVTDNHSFNYAYKHRTKN